MAEAIAVAHEAGIRVVAEGIETDADLALVRRLGCDRGQGYLLGRPLTRDDLGLLLG
jgi:EAL domain-containing protein (putative c-di-GMP-specific phosphodiesterase class I)